MCLGVPGRVIEIEDGVATVDFFGVKRRVRLDVVDAPVAPGDYVLNHVGFAIRRIPAEEIADTLALYDELLRSASDDLLGNDVRGTITGLFTVLVDGAPTLSCCMLAASAEGRKVTTVRAVIGISSPVLGLRPGRWFLRRRSKLPNPDNFT